MEKKIFEMGVHVPESFKNMKPMEPGTYVLTIPTCHSEDVRHIKQQWDEVMGTAAIKSQLVIVTLDMDFTLLDNKQFGFSMAMKVMQARHWVRRTGKDWKITIIDNKFIMQYDNAPKTELHWMCSEDIMANDYILEKQGAGE
jgi:hypothetical protein